MTLCEITENSYMIDHQCKALMVYEFNGKQILSMSGLLGERLVSLSELIGPVPLID